MLMNFKIAFMIFVVFFTLNLEANPVLARQYGMECSSCHSQVPALNDMGLMFVRNGFRTSKYDTTSLKGLLDANSSNRHYPVGAMLGLSDNSKHDQVNRLVKLYLGGTLTDSLTLYALTKESFNSNKKDQDLFESSNSQAYFQYNILEAKHVLRAGLLSPLTQLGNVERSMAHSGLHGTGGHGIHYTSPLDRADVRVVKGAEYSYLADNNILLLVSYGEQVDRHGEQRQRQRYGHGHGEGQYSNIAVQQNDDAFLTGMKYTTAENYKIGVIYNYVDMDKDDFYSVIVPIEKEYSLLTWNSSLVYANSNDEDYIGLENAFTFPLGDMEHIKAIVNVDKDENDDTNFGYSLGYTKVYKMFFFQAVASRVNTEIYSSNKAIASINLIF